MKLKCINDKYLKQVKTGERNDYKPSLVLDQIYELKETILDSEGNPHYDVGLKSSLSYVRSIETGENLERGDEIHWCHPSRFEVVVEVPETELEAEVEHGIKF